MLLLAPVDARLALVPAALFLLLCLIAPFMYRFGFFLPVISRGCSGQRIVALTFDDGPDPATTPLLLDLLAAHGVRATFFVIGRRAKAHPALIRMILDGGHTVGNHSFSHDTLVAFKGVQMVEAEIAASQRVLSGLGVTPLVYRPPVGITYPLLGRVLPGLGLTAVTFSCLARDGGNRSIGRLAERILRRVRPDDIIMLHEGLPLRSAPVSHWLGQVSKILAGIAQKGLKIRPLAEVIGRSVDRRTALGGSPCKNGPAGMGPSGNCASTADRRPDSRR
jgi:peptidoglycan-N-acetylglucosamine deacetylase